jgi:hypothetical protein
MAVELMRNTGYDITGALTCLALLDSVDTDKFSSGIALASRFNFPGFPFKKRWVAEESGIIMDAPDTSVQKRNETDSLKTHPDCKERIRRLAGKINQYPGNGSKKFIVDQVLFLKLKNEFDFEILRYCFKSSQVSKCLYFSLQILHSLPDDPLLHAFTGKCLNQLYTAQKNHELGKITDLPGAGEGEKYDTLLNFIQNIRLQELAAVAYYFLLQDQQRFSGNEEFTAALIVSKENFGMLDEKKEWVEFFKRNFPHSKYRFNN